MRKAKKCVTFVTSVVLRFKGADRQENTVVTLFFLKNKNVTIVTESEPIFSSDFSDRLRKKCNKFCNRFCNKINHWFSISKIICYKKHTFFGNLLRFGSGFSESSKTLQGHGG
jgi:hypothetical protein